MLGLASKMVTILWASAGLHAGKATSSWHSAMAMHQTEMHHHQQQHALQLGSPTLKLFSGFDTRPSSAKPDRA
jgi:hypothetical protein